MKNIFKAFTLAELLVAMFLFGILAVMLVPKVTNNAEKELFVTQTKKVQNDIQQAFLLLVSENSGSLRFLCTGDNCLMERFQDKLESAMTREDGRAFFTQADLPAGGNCDNQNNEKQNKPKDRLQQACRYRDKVPMLINKTTFAPLVHINNNNFAAINLKNGATVSIIYEPACAGQFRNAAGDAAFTGIVNAGMNGLNNQLCGYMQVDVNGAKIPNMVGKDIHYFWITSPDGIVPFGEFNEFGCTVPQKGAAVASKDALGCTYRMISRSRIDYY